MLNVRVIMGACTRGDSCKHFLERSGLSKWLSLLHNISNKWCWMFTILNSDGSSKDGTSTQCPSVKQLTASWWSLRVLEPGLCSYHVMHTATGILCFKLTLFGFRKWNLANWEYCVDLNIFIGIIFPRSRIYPALTFRLSDSAMKDHQLIGCKKETALIQNVWRGLI